MTRENWKKKRNEFCFKEFLHNTEIYILKKVILCLLYFSTRLLMIGNRENKSEDRGTTYLILSDDLNIYVLRWTYETVEHR